MPAQISRAYEQMGKTLMVQKLLEKNPATLAKLKECQRYLKTNPKGFKIPDFTDPFAERERECAAATAARVCGTSKKGASLVSWNYELPKRSSQQDASARGGFSHSKNSPIIPTQILPIF